MQLITMNIGTGRNAIFATNHFYQYYNIYKNGNNILGLNIMVNFYDFLLNYAINIQCYIRARSHNDRRRGIREMVQLTLSRVLGSL